MQTLHEKPVSGTSTQTVFCLCDNESRTLTLTVLETGNARCPKCSKVLAFCPACGQFADTRPITLEADQIKLDSMSPHTSACAACGHCEYVPAIM